MRETRNSDDTGFNWVVYGKESMAKETVGARVPVAIADQVHSYVETHEITRTAAIELFIRTALEDPEQFRCKQSYTVEIREDREGEPRHVSGWKAELRHADQFVGEWDSTEALTARLPGEIVRGIEEWAESQDIAKSVAAEDLLVRGLKADPLPESNPDPIPEHTDYSEAVVKTVELEPDEADLFRRCRLHYRKGPSEAVNWLIGATYSTSSARVGWSKPDEVGEE